MMNFAQIQETIVSGISQLSPMLIRAGAVFLFWVLFRKVVLRALRSLMERHQVDPVQMGFFNKVVGVALWIVTILAVLTQFGIETTSLIAVVGAAGIGIGLALKDSMQNLASGFMLIMLKPFKAGDVVELEGKIATVDQIGVFTTHLTTLDNKKLFLPNNEVFGKPLLNYTGNEQRRIDLVIRVAYRSDLLQVKELLRETVLADARVLLDPELFIGVGELNPDSIELVIRAWVPTEEWWPTRCALLEAIVLRLEQEGISLPSARIEVLSDR